MTPMILQKAFWLLLTLAIVVPVHEYGHDRVAVACRVRVLRFSIGFGRVLWSRRFGPDGTEFAISMLPLGGYVKMLDEREGPVAPAEGGWARPQGDPLPGPDAGQAPFGAGAAGTGCIAAIFADDGCRRSQT